MNILQESILVGDEKYFTRIFYMNILHKYFTGKHIGGGMKNDVGVTGVYTPLFPESFKIATTNFKK